MAALCQKPIGERDLQGLKYFRILLPLTERLHKNATQRDRAGNRRFVLRSVRPACSCCSSSTRSLKALRQLTKSSQLNKSPKAVRLLSDPPSVRSAQQAGSSDPELLQEIIRELTHDVGVRPVMSERDAEALRDLQAVDGSLLPALPKMAWALWQEQPASGCQNARPFRCAQGCSYPRYHHNRYCLGTRRVAEQPGPSGFYVIDRGYRDYTFFQEIVDAGASFVGRVQDNTVIHVAEERPLTLAARAAGIVRDVEIKHTGPEKPQKPAEAIVPHSS